MHQKDAHCSYCGGVYEIEQAWPRNCVGCGNISYRNPLPVAVVLLPVDGGLLTIRRTIEPEAGKLALPGGYINLGETWQEAAARELFEETGIEIRAKTIEDFRVLSSPVGVLVVFGLAPATTSKKLPSFQATNETSEWVVIDRPRRLAFPIHTQVMKEYFARHSPAPEKQVRTRKTK